LINSEDVSIVGRKDLEKSGEAYVSATLMVEIRFQLIREHVWAIKEILMSRLCLFTFDKVL